MCLRVVLAFEFFCDTGMIGKKVPSMDDLSPRASREPSILAAA